MKTEQAVPAVNERLLQAADQMLRAYETGLTAQFPNQLDAADELRSAVAAAIREAEQPAEQAVRMPTTAGEAELMAKLGLMWLEQNAPDRLAEQAVAAQEPNIKAQLNQAYEQGRKDERAYIERKGSPDARPECAQEPVQPVPNEEHGQLSLEVARNIARTALGYAQAFDGKGISWHSPEPWPHRIELAQALDWITDLGAMVFNLADRVRPPITQQQIDELIGLADEYASRMAECEIDGVGVEGGKILDANRDEARAEFIARLQEVCRG